MNAVDLNAVATSLLGRILPVIRANVPDDIGADYFDGFVSRNRGALVAAFASILGAKKTGPASIPSSAIPGGEPDTWSARDRTRINLLAMGILARTATANTNDERAILQGYSGWGGLSLAKVADQFPAGFPVPETRGLVHEYYTPVSAWKAVAAHLFGDGGPFQRTGPELRALEPSVGIGRALRAFERTPTRWTTVEASKVSSRLVTALYPVGDGYHDVHYRGFFEGFAAAHSDDRFDLVVSNPPYGPRGEAGEEDTDPRYQTKRAYLYFIYRALDLLETGGIGVFLVPTGFLTGRSPEMRKARERVLRGHHLLSAYRLPSTPPAGGTRADVVYEGFVVDALFFERRPALLAQVPEADVGVLEGGYYLARPYDVLGTPLGMDEGWEPGMPKPRRGFQLEGRFAGLPAWNPRARTDGEAAVVTTRKVLTNRGGISRADVAIDALPVDLASAVALGERIDAFLARVASGDQLATLLWDELRRDALAWRELHGDPAMHLALRELVERRVVGATRFLSVWQRGGTLNAALAFAPKTNVTYTGGGTPDAIARWAYAQQGGRLTLAEALGAWEARTGTKTTVGPLVAALIKVGWCLDGDGWNELHPPEVYFTGMLWPKLDRAETHAGDVVADAQIKRLRETIGWRSAPDILRECMPTDAWLPLDIVSDWCAAAKLGRHTLARKDGLLQPAGVDYATLENTDKARTSGFSRDFLSFLGWSAFDNGLWNPEKADILDPETGEQTKEPVDEARRRQVKDWVEHWEGWVSADDAIQARVENGYNRTMRGYVEPVYANTPVPIARWSDAIRLHDYQNEAVRKITQNHAGLLAFDVGLGKTYAGLATLAVARQEGWARRPVVLVPNSIIWKWKKDFARVLPDYRVVVIGADRYESRGRMVSRPDSGIDRARKWTEFQAGQWDVVLVTYSAFARQQIDPEFVQRYVDQTTALRRSIAMSLEAAQDPTDEVKRKPSERKEADSKERVRAWVGSILAPPKNQAYDPGIDWHALGIDFLMVDEAQNFKNLFRSARESSAEGDATKRAWALDFRAASVREHSAGGGVVLLSATPAKNAAVEFFTLLHLVNPALWAQVAITNHEDFVGRYGRFQRKKVVDGSGQKVVERDVVTGFKNLDELRSVVYRWATFRTAEEVGLKLPEVRVEQHLVQVNGPQQSELSDAYHELANIEEKLKKLHGEGMERVRQSLILKKQGIALRIYLIYLHPNLPGVGKRGDAEQMNPHDGPKLVACVDQVLATAAKVCRPGAKAEWCLDCGHIIFCDNIAVHGWVRSLLIERGVAPERIAVLNAVEAKDLEKRQAISEAFNGVGAPGDDDYVEPTVNVVIANAIAHEGMDLQRRTCAIHHLDVPWDPATLQQRNGRGVRQGNTFDAVTLHYYFVEGSNEAWKVQRIERKRGWMAELVAGQARKTNTTMDDAALANEPDEDEVEDLALKHAPDDVRARILEARKAQAAVAKLNKRTEAQRAANRVLREVSNTWRRVRNETDPLRLQLLRDEAEAAMKKIGAFRDLWNFDWHATTARIRDVEPFIPTSGPAMYPGDVFERGGRLFEVGSLGVHEEYVRNPKTYVDELVSKPGVWVRPIDQLESLEHLRQSEEFDTFNPARAPLDAVEVATERLRANLADQPRVRVRLLMIWPKSFWHRLAPSTQERAWPILASVFNDAIVSGNAVLPAERAGRLLVLGDGSSLPPGAALLPPTQSGWTRFLALLVREEREPSLATGASQFWWGKRIPRASKVLL